MGHEEPRTAYNNAYMRDGREEMRKRNATRSEKELSDTLAGAPVQVA